MKVENNRNRIMCTVTIDIDEKTLRDVNPNLSDIAAIREWVQQLIDCRIREMVAEDEETISVEELRAMLHKTIHEEYAKP